MNESASPAPPSTSRAGLFFAVGAYALWGVLPAYFLLLPPAGPWEIVAFRVLMSLLFSALLLTITGGWRPFLALLRDRRTMLLMLAAAVVIYLNWQTFVVAVLLGHVIESSLGYFINPIVTVLLGVLVLREKVRPPQWIALGIAFIAILVIAIGYGNVPWVALVLAFSFAIYGLIKRVVGPRVDAIGGLTLETAWLTPVAIVQLIVVGVVGGGVQFGQHGIGHALAMIGAGVATTTPLLLFAAGARRIPLVALGMTQFLAPVLQFLFGWLVLDEAMPLERWIGFGLVWVALVVLMTDAILASRPPRRSSLERV